MIEPRPEPIPTASLLPLGGRYMSYSDLIETMRVETLIEKTDRDYQGDTYALLRQETLKGETIYGLLTFGWGSCSGCDVLEAANDSGEVLKVRDQLYADIRWFESVGAFLSWADSGVLQDGTVWYGREGLMADLIAEARLLEPTQDLVAEAIESITREAQK